MRTDSDLFEMASLSLACRDLETLLRTFAARAAVALDAQAVLVWVNDQAGTGWTCRESCSKPRAVERLIAGNGTIKNGFIKDVYDSKAARRLSGQDLAAAPLVHLQEDFRAQISSVLYLPLPGAGGVVEILKKRSAPFTEQDVHFWGEAAGLAGQAMSNLEVVEQQRQAQLEAVERLTALYDLGRTFTSTLELDALLPIVTRKIRDVLTAELCNLWLVDSRSEELHLVQTSGGDSAAVKCKRASAKEGLLAEIVQKGHPRLLAEAAAGDGLEERRQTIGTVQIKSWIAAPLTKDTGVLGVVEVLNKIDGSPYNEDDLFFLSSISEQAAVALYNAQLLVSERKAHTLNALLKISQEITSTLNLEQVLSTVVNQARLVLPFNRCVIGYFDRGRFVTGAVSGEEEVPKTAEIEELRAAMEWTARQSDPVSADFREDGWHGEPHEAHARIIPFLQAYGYNGCCVLPLRDDQGAVGAIALLSAEGDFLSATHREIVGILASQTTAAIRNSQLYEQLPLASVLQGLVQRRQRVQSAFRGGRWVRYARRAAVATGLLVLIPWPLRVPTNATAVPAERRIVSTIEGGVVERVFVREGDVVRFGDLLAQVNDGEDRVKLAQAQEALESARRELGEGEFRNDPAAAGQARMRADLHLAEVQFAQKRLGEAYVRAPISGIIVTPKVEEKVGTFLRPGEALAEIVGQERIAAELSVEETELSLVRPGRNVRLKLNAFPTKSFEGTIERVGAQARPDSSAQYFIVRAVFANPGGIVRDGMVGRARIRAGGGWFESGWYPVGYVLLRTPVRWLWTRTWTLLP
jgi:RND family efflux transporter MFP subunit